MVSSARCYLADWKLFPNELKIKVRKHRIHNSASKKLEYYHRNIGPLLSSVQCQAQIEDFEMGGEFL